MIGVVRGSVGVPVIVVEGGLVCFMASCEEESAALVVVPASSKKPTLVVLVIIPRVELLVVTGA